MKAPSTRGWAFGPGLVHLLGSMGSNDLILNSLVGATFGYSLLWALIPAYVLHFFIAEASSRYVLTTGESIAEGYAQLGRPVMLALTGAIIVRRHLNNLFSVPLLGQASHMLLPLPTAYSQMIWSLTWAGLGLWLMFQGAYPAVERRAKLLAILLTTSLVIVVLMSRPNPAAVVAGLLVPAWPGSTAIVLVMALAGTTVGSINHLKYPAYVYETGWRSRAMARSQRIDLALSCLGQFTLAALIQIAAATTIYETGAPLRTLQDLSAVLAAPLGEAGRLVLLVGMWATVFSSYIGSNTGYSLIVADVYERYLRTRNPEEPPELRDVVRRRAYHAFLTFFCVSPLYVLFTTWEPFWLSVLASSVFFALAPILMAGLLIITSTRERMGEHVSGWASRITIGAAIAISLILTYHSLSDLVVRLLTRVST